MDIRTYSAILIISAIFSGVLTQNAPISTPPSAPNQTTAAPPTPPLPSCPLVKEKPAHISERYQYRINVTEGENEKVCLLAEFNAVILVNQTTTEYLNLGEGKVNTEKSSCDQKLRKATLVVDFLCGQIDFSVEGSQTVGVNSIHGYYQPTGSVKLDFHHEGILFKPTKPGYYYRCDSEQTVPLSITNAATNATIDLLVNNLGLEAFTDTNKTTFSMPAETCESKVTPVNDLVPIAVGACLASLVVIVLIAYFVGRRRWSERSTYESV